MGVRLYYFFCVFTLVFGVFNLPAYGNTTNNLINTESNNDIDISPNKAENNLLANEEECIFLEQGQMDFGLQQLPRAPSICASVIDYPTRLPKTGACAAEYEADKIPFFGNILPMFSDSCRPFIARVVCSHTFPRCMPVKPRICKSYCAILKASCTQRNDIDGMKFLSEIGYFDFDCDNEVVFEQNSEVCHSPTQKVVELYEAKCVPYRGAACQGVLKGEVYIRPGFNEHTLYKTVDQLHYLWSLSSIQDGCDIAQASYSCSTIVLTCEYIELFKNSLNQPVMIPVPRLPCRSVCDTYASRCESFFIRFQGMVSNMRPDCNASQHNSIMCPIPKSPVESLTSTPTQVYIETEGQENASISPTLLPNIPHMKAVETETETRNSIKHKFATLSNHINTADENNRAFVAAVTADAKDDFDFFPEKNTVLVEKRPGSASFPSTTTEHFRYTLCQGNSCGNEIVLESHCINFDDDTSNSSGSAISTLNVLCPYPLVIPENHGKNETINRIFDSHCSPGCPMGMWTKDEYKVFDNIAIAGIVISMILSIFLSLTWFCFDIRRQNMFVTYMTYVITILYLFIFIMYIKNWVEGKESGAQALCRTNYIEYHMGDGGGAETGYCIFNAVLLVYCISCIVAWWLVQTITVFMKVVLEIKIVPGSRDDRIQNICFHIVGFGFPLISIVGMIASQSIGGYSTGLSLCFFSQGRVVQDNVVDYSLALFFIPIMVYTGLGTLCMAGVMIKLAWISRKSLHNNDKTIWQRCMCNVYIRIILFILTMCALWITVIIYKAELLANLSTWEAGLQAYYRCTLVINYVTETECGPHPPDRMPYSLQVLITIAFTWAGGIITATNATTADIYVSWANFWIRYFPFLRKLQCCIRLSQHRGTSDITGQSNESNTYTHNSDQKNSKDSTTSTSASGSGSARRQTTVQNNKYFYSPRHGRQSIAANGSGPNKGNNLNGSIELRNSGSLGSGSNSFANSSGEVEMTNLNTTKGRSNKNSVFGSVTNGLGSIAESYEDSKLKDDSVIKGRNTVGGAGISGEHLSYANHIKHSGVKSHVEHFKHQDDYESEDDNFDENHGQRQYSQRNQRDNRRGGYNKKSKSHYGSHFENPYGSRFGTQYGSYFSTYEHDSSDDTDGTTDTVDGRNAFSPEDLEEHMKEHGHLFADESDESARVTGASAATVGSHATRTTNTTNTSTRGHERIALPKPNFDDEGRTSKHSITSIDSNKSTKSSNHAQSSNQHKRQQTSPVDNIQESPDIEEALEAKAEKEAISVKTTKVTVTPKPPTAPKPPTSKNMKEKDQNQDQNPPKEAKDTITEEVVIAISQEDNAKGSDSEAGK